MNFEFHLITVIALLALFLIGPARIFGFLSGLSIFLYAQTAMGLGILPLLDPVIEADRVHARVILVTLILYVLTATVAGVVRNSLKSQSSPTIQIIEPKSGVRLLIVLSIAVSALYFAAVGHIAFFETLRGAFLGTDVDAASLRLESYSGSTYFFPGYVNQFKNSLLPALVVVVVHYLFHKKVSGRLVLSAALITVSTVFLLGTGQRGAFVKFTMIALVYVWITNRHHFKSFVVWIGLFAISLFFLSTIASGRASTDLDSAGSPLERLAILLGQLVERVTGSNQGSAVAGFRYIYDEPVQYGGQWFESLVGLLPGLPGSNLDSQIFATIYGGSTRGTSPPSIWGSIYHNFGEIGCIAIAVVLALLLVKISTLGSKQSEMNTFQAIGVAGINVIVGSWIAGSPVYLFNFGLVIYLLFFLYGSRRMKRERNYALRGANNISVGQVRPGSVGR